MKKKITLNEALKIIEKVQKVPKKKIVKYFFLRIEELQKNEKKKKKN